MSNPYKNTSQLNITTSNRSGKTLMEDVSFTTPFKITRPFYEEDGALKIITIAVSAGLMEGDHQEINFNILEGSNTIISSQSYEKIHKMKKNEAKRSTSIYIGKNAFLRYLPLPTIPYADSAFTSYLDVNLEDETSQLIMSEIITCGRYVRGEIFQYKYFRSQVTVSQQGNLLYRDNAYFNPQEFDIKGMGMLEGHTHVANILIFNLSLSQEIISQIRQIIEQNGLDGGLSYTWDNDLVIRILAFNSQSLERISNKIINLIRQD